MKTEIDMVRAAASVSTCGKTELDILAIRKALNEAATSLTHDALFKNDLPMLSQKLAEMMIVTARSLIRLDLEPDLENFVYACAELIGIARKNMDDAIRFDNMDDVKLAAVMMEIVLKGCATTLGLQLEKLMATELGDLHE